MSHHSHHSHHTPTHHIHHSSSSHHFSSSTNSQAQPADVVLGINDANQVAAQITKNAVNRAGRGIAFGCILSTVIMAVVAVGVYLVIHQVASISFLH